MSFIDIKTSTQGKSQHTLINNHIKVLATSFKLKTMLNNILNLKKNLQTLQTYKNRKLVPVTFIKSHYYKILKCLKQDTEVPAEISVTI